MTQKEKPVGRTQELRASAASLFGKKNDLPVFAPSSLKDPDFSRTLQDLHPAICVVASYGKIIPPHILKIPTYGFINLHPSLLPKYRGATPVPFTLLKGETKTGVTIIIMNEEMDAGDILTQREATVYPDDTSPTLLPRLFQLGADMLNDTLIRFMQGEVKPLPQDHTQTTYTSLLKKEMGRIDWQKESAEQILNKIRAFTPWPGVFTFSDNKRLKILTATQSPDPDPKAPPGTFFHQGIQTVQGVLIPKMVQPEGKKSMSWEEFLRGNPVRSFS